MNKPQNEFEIGELYFSTKEINDKLAWGTPGDTDIVDETRFSTQQFNVFELVGYIYFGPEFYVVGLDSYTVFMPHEIPWLCKLNP
jgi:hypothetical protein